MAKVSVAREELYEQVWKTPMNRLAPRYGISDVALGKICRRLNVPRPNRGYWAQLAAGAKVARPPLPKPTQGQAGTALLESVENPVVRVPAPPAPQVPVGDTLVGAHRAVEALGRLLRTAEVDKFGRLIVPGQPEPVLAVTLETHRRALLFLDALARGVIARGHQVGVYKEEGGGGPGSSLSFSIGVEDVDIFVEESLDRRVLPPPKTKNPGLDQGRGTPLQSYEYFPSGRLRLSLHEAATGRRHSWADTATRHLDQQLGRVILGLEAEVERRREYHADKERQRTEAERVHAQRREEERRLEDERDRARYQRLLVKDLRKMVRNWAGAERIRSFLNAIERIVPEADRGAGFAEWLGWATKYAAQLDPMSRPQEIPKKLEPDRPSPDGEPSQD